MASSDSDAPVVRTIVRAPGVTAPQAPYSHAVIADRLIFTAGNVGLDPTTNKLVPGGIKAETEQALTNIGAILTAAGSSYDKVVKVTILLADIADWPVVNEIYKQYFKSDTIYPARTAYQAAALPLGSRIEIEAVAITGPVVEGKQAML